MDYTISHFTWSFWDTYRIPHDYTQKSTKPILALKLSVSAIITPGGLPEHLLGRVIIELIILFLESRG